MKFYGSIEAGGTKFVCAIGNDSLEIVNRMSFPTTTPNDTLVQVFKFFDEYELEAIGIGSFGPVDLNPKSPTYGYITTTPKPGWGNFGFLDMIKNRYDIPITFTTDVNAAAFGENMLGAATDVDSCIYLTVGTGIGGGAVINGQLIEGYSHPEMGHILIKRHPEDIFSGTCPYHHDCLEGMASGPAIEKRFGIKAENLKSDHPAWKFESHYLAQALMNYILILSPEKIILGGGVMEQKQLFPLIRTALKSMLNGYVELPDLDTYIVPPKLDNNAATLGCLMLAKQAIEK